MKDQRHKSVQTIAKECGCEDRTVQKWCQNNGVPYNGEGVRKEYLIYPEFEEAFKNRPRPGRPWDKEKTKKKKPK